MQYCSLYPPKFLGVLNQTEMKPFQLDMFFGGLPNLVQGAFYLRYAKRLSRCYRNRLAVSESTKSDKLSSCL